MTAKKIITLFISTWITVVLFAQDTAFVKDLNEVVITATRTETKLGNVAVPVQLISNKTISQSGSVRVNDILQEQTGLYTTSAGATTSAGGGVFGNGIQIQGLAPNHVLILLDGEPMIGRQGGIIDLTRLAVGNIRKIEIVKGPSSSLYGSEAMGGVVNIITDQPKQNSFNASLRYGRFNATDANLGYSMKKDKWGMQWFGNRNSSDGFDLDKTMPGKTVDPFTNYTGQFRVQYQPATKTKLSLSTRYYNEQQQNFFPVHDLATSTNINITGKGSIREYGINPVITQQFNNDSRTSFRFNFNRYEYEQNLEKQSDKSPYYYDFFQQDFYRLENQTDLRFGKKHYTVAGGGIVRNRLNTTRYSGIKHSEQYYFFAQDEWKLLEKLLLIGGIRYDKNSDYASATSPKLAVQYKINPHWRLSASYGSGFKAPDFQQQYLNFLNTAAGGYVVYGANEISTAELEKQRQQGIISEILSRAYQLALLAPETSRGFNLGNDLDLSEKLNVKLNLFRNDIDNLIQVDVIAYRSNGAPVYSYFNVKKAFTQGVELQVKYAWNKYLQAEGGYQFLSTADKADLQRIKEGSVFTRDIQSGTVTKMERSDYGGLPDRSAHMANARLFYTDEAKGWSGSLRAIYRGRWGTYDKEGNGVINRSDEFAPGFLLLNITAGKTIGNIKAQAGIDNLLNYKDVVNLPGQPGIQPYISLSYSFSKRHK